jgi:hypothetical protein
MKSQQAPSALGSNTLSKVTAVQRNIATEVAAMRVVAGDTPNHLLLLKYYMGSKWMRIQVHYLAYLQVHNLPDTIPFHCLFAKYHLDNNKTAEAKQQFQAQLDTLNPVASSNIWLRTCLENGCSRCGQPVGQLWRTGLLQRAASLGGVGTNSWLAVLSRTGELAKTSNRSVLEHCPGQQI